MDATEETLRERITSINRDTLTNLERQLRTPLGVIPFVGAGISASVRLPGEPPRFPQWGELLRSLASDFAFEAEVGQLLTKGDYEGAASVIDQKRPNVLTRSIRNKFDIKIDEAQVLQGPVSYLPFLANGPVITTNYDYVLERAFEAAGRSFERIISGPLADSTVAAVHGNERALIKIHGDCRESTFRVLTVEDYERAYGSMKAAVSRADIGSLTWLLFTNRPLLFLGCSLAQDRTVLALSSIRQQLPGLSHFAVLAAEQSPDAWQERRQRLEALGIQVLWFMPGKFEEIEGLLGEILETASVRPLRLNPAARAPHRLATPVASLVDIATTLPDTAPAAEVRKYRVEIERIVEALRDERLAFFLGAYAALQSSFPANSFYAHLAEKFECPALSGDRTAVASFIIRRYGHRELWKQVRAAIQTSATAPSVIHRFIAALPGFLRQQGKSGQLCIITTNYDTLMERALTEAGEAFHQLYYVNDGGDGMGCFRERLPDGAIRQVEKPENLRHHRSSAHLLVKLNGGISYYGDLEEQVSIDGAHFERLAARVPAILPRFLWTELMRRSLLFLGHGLAEPDVRALIECSAGNERTVRAWAVQKRPSGRKLLPAWQASVEHWRGFGLKVLETDLERFCAALCREMAGRRNVPAPGTASREKVGPGGRRMIVFVSYPNDIAPRVMKRIVSEVIKRGFQVWLWDAIPYAFPDNKADNIISLIHGENYVDGAIRAASSANAVLFLISPWTLQSKFQADELSAGLNGDRVVPCIVDEGVHFQQLPAILQKLYVAKVTEQSLTSKEGKARLQKLIKDLSHIAGTKREPADGSLEQGRGDLKPSGEP